MARGAGGSGIVARGCCWCLACWLVVWVFCRVGVWLRTRRAAGFGIRCAVIISGGIAGSI